MNDHYAKCVLCSREIDLSTMGANALDSSAKKHGNIVKNLSAGLVCSFFRKEEQSVVSSTGKFIKETCKDDKAVKGKLNHYLLDDGIINAEILWTLK